MKHSDLLFYLLCALAVVGWCCVALRGIGEWRRQGDPLMSKEAALRLINQDVTEWVA